MTRRKGAIRRTQVALEVQDKLNRGLDETVNLMEWLVVDFAQLAATVFAEAQYGPHGENILRQLSEMSAGGVTKKLILIGAAIARELRDPSHPLLEQLSTHRSDVVRQWAAYAVNAFPGLNLSERLNATRRFAADHNMTVREAAWMAFRPHVVVDLKTAIGELGAWVHAAEPNVRRFAIEVTRPRSVWGAHIRDLKLRPQIGHRLLVPVKSDPSKYVRTAVANWLNDASKTRPDWVASVCAEWAHSATEHTLWIIRRATRSMPRALPLGW